VFPRLIQWPPTIEENQRIEFEIYNLKGIGRLEFVDQSLNSK